MTRSFLIPIVLVVVGVTASADQRGLSPPGPPGSTGVSVTSTVSEVRLRLAVDRMMYDRWYPAASIPPPPTHPDDQGMLTAALISSDIGLRDLAIRLIGRFERAADVAVVGRFLADTNPTIRRDAVLAMGHALDTSTGVDTAGAEQILETRVLIEQGATTVRARQEAGPVIAAILRTIGQMHYDATTDKRVQLFLVSMREVDPLATVIIQNFDGPLTSEARDFLLRFAKPVPPIAPSARALEALIAASAGTADVAVNAYRYRCVSATGGGLECGVEIRVLGVRMMDPRDPEILPTFEEALHDPLPQIRAEAFRKLPLFKDLQKVACAAPLDALKAAIANDDFNGAGTLRDIDMLSPKCQETEEIVAALKVFALLLGDPLNSLKWQVPAKALTKLAVFAPNDAKTLVHDVASSHDVWQVRVAAVEASDVIGDQAQIVLLTDDAEPNVRAAAIRALARVRSSAAAAAALKALESDDHQLVGVAATSLRDFPDAAKRLEASAALVTAFKRLTRLAKDTSRAPRLAVLTRLKEFARPDETGMSPLYQWRLELEPALKDFDPIVASAAADLLGAITGTRPAPTPTYRPPEQPTEAELEEALHLSATLTGSLRPGALPGALPRAHATLQFSTGEVVYLKFSLADAPITIARFVKLARTRYYDGQIVYRVVPEGWASAGSPGANDDSGSARFWRDEITAEPHHGSTGDPLVGLLTHGRDAGDGRFFIAFENLPAYEDTVFAQITAGRLPAMLDGATILAVKIAPQLPGR